MDRLNIQIKPWLTAILLSLIWIAVSLGGAWFLVTASFERTTNAFLVEQTRRGSNEVREKLSQTDADDAAHDEVVRRTLLRQLRENPALAYLMVWESGSIKYHSDPDKEGGTLNLDTWPSFEQDETVRISKVKTGPWDPAIGPVVDITLQIPVHVSPNHNHTYYLSAGYKQSWLDQRFWTTQRPQFVLAGLFTLVGWVALLLAIAVSGRRIERTRIQQQQSVLAHTSLLTERGMLASVLAHEVRSPLTALRFNLHALRTLIATHSNKIERQLELGDGCDREIRRLDLMLNDFLTRTQVISPAENTPVNQVVNEALEFMRPSLEQRGIRIIMHLDGSNPSVVINAAELRQVLLNLCTNAQEAMPKGGTLAVSTLSEQDNVSLLVRDNGKGIPQDLQQRIFEPFFSTKPQGSGLGLALVRRVISGAGGKVFCESTVGEGTTFRLVLPRGGNTDQPTPMAHIAPEGAEVSNVDEGSIDEVPDGEVPEAER